MVMRILVTGSHGLIGSALVQALAGEGHQVLKLVRSAPTHPSEIHWDPQAKIIAWAALSQIDAAVHLAGENLAGGRWTKARRARILKSRVQGTEVLSTALAQLVPLPRVLLSASAIGFYGNRGDEVLTEQSSAGTGFLSEVCQAWEAASSPASRAGIRVVHLRFGVVLSKDGGALGKMLLPFKLGLGGPVGDGHQFMSWIALSDAIMAIRHALEHEELSGPLNVAAPQPVSSGEFAHILGRVLSRPAFIPVPKFALRLALGQMADEALLASTRVEPAKLMASGFHFRFPGLEQALRALFRTE